MRKIAKAPDLRELVEKHQTPELMTKLMSGKIPMPERYYHWDKLRHLPPPDDLTAEQWWMAIKFSRSFGKKPLPVNDAQGQPFTYSLTDEILKRLHEIDGTAKGFIGTEGKIGSEEAKDRYIVSSLIEEAITSSQLEGASTTRQVANAMIRSGRKPKDKHEQMIFNNYMAMRRIQRHTAEDITIENLLNLHETLTEHTMDNPHDAGRIQDESEERVVIGDEYGQIFHRPPPAKDLPERLKALVEFANSTADDSGPFIHPIIRAIALHFIVGYDHPFVDGNGRTARALFYHSVLRSGYNAFAFISISQIIKKAPAQYGYAYQYVETDDNDATYFIHNQLDVICRAIEDLEKYIERKNRELARIESRLKALPLNYRQLALLSHALRHPGHEYTIKSHQTSHNCAYATARSDLLSLAVLNLLEKQTSGKKKLRFLAPTDLEENVKKLSDSR